MRKIISFVMVVMAVVVVMAGIMTSETVGVKVLQLSQWYSLYFYGAVSLLMLAVAMKISRGVIVSALTWGILAIVVVEACHGLLQLYGNVLSGHVMFGMTGSFYNPGPFGGFLALGVPLVLDRYYAEGNRYVRGLALLCGMVIMCVLPATMSRTAWVAAVVSVLAVLVSHGKLRISRRMILIILSSFIFVALLLFVVFEFKVASAIGRFHLWYISLLTILEEPICGHGVFGPAYAEAQERYFSVMDKMSLTSHGASCPDYAFNEYLHYAVVYGLPLVVLVVVLSVVVMLQGYRKGCQGLSGVMTAVGVFSLASYPLHIPMFVAVLSLSIIGILLVIIDKEKLLIFSFIGLALVGLMVASKMEPQIEVNRRWDKIHYLYHNKMYDVARREYEKILPQMKENGIFLFEYGHILHNLATPKQSNNILMCSMEKIGDPMVLNIIGKNYMQMGCSDSAKYYYRKSICRLPSRMYPYYLLFGLQFSEGDVSGMKRTKSIIDKPFKVESTATREMRSEVSEKMDLVKTKQ